MPILQYHLTMSIISILVLLAQEAKDFPVACRVVSGAVYVSIPRSEVWMTTSWCRKNWSRPPCLCQSPSWMQWRSGMWGDLGYLSGLFLEPLLKAVLQVRNAMVRHRLLNNYYITYRCRVRRSLYTIGAKYERNVHPARYVWCDQASWYDFSNIDNVDPK